MERFKTAKKNRNKSKSEDAMESAIRTLNLENIPVVVQKERGREAAILLKEIIDRIIVINYNLIPDKNVDRWRLKDTEITIAKIQNGDRKGEYAFTQRTVSRSRIDYEKVKDLPYLEGSGQGAGYKESWWNKEIPPSLKKTAFWLPNWQWLGIFISLLIGLILNGITRRIHSILLLIVKRNQNSFLYKITLAIEKPAGLLVACGFWFFSLYVLQIQGQALIVFGAMTEIVFGLGLIWVCYQLVDILADSLQKITEKTETDLDDQLVPLVRKVLRVLVVVVGVLALIQNLGYNVFSILAGLGLGGLAFALAAKDTCANLLGSIMILLDQPFRVGDWIVAGNAEGTVEEVGFRSTRIRTFYNSIIVVPNSEMANVNIDNMGQREFRRVNMKLGITYDTPPEKIEAYVEGLKNIIKANSFTRKDYFHVVFSEFSSSSLNILIYFFLKVPNWSEELVEKQNLFLEFIRLANDLEIDFAFPTQTIHVETTPQDAKPPRHRNYSSSEMKKVAEAFGPHGDRSRPKGAGIFIPPYEE
tara:strand:- start:2589 stop:4178 length:1590 start_codon:yes stop_codon:yes gene_type:complete